LASVLSRPRLDSRDSRQTLTSENPQTSKNLGNPESESSNSQYSSGNTAFAENYVGNSAESEVDVGGKVEAEDVNDMDGVSDVWAQLYQSLLAAVDTLPLESLRCGDCVCVRMYIYTCLRTKYTRIYM